MISDAAAEHNARRLRDEPDFRRYWWARLLSSAGTIVSYIALPVLVYRLSGSAGLTAAVSALERASYGAGFDRVPHADRGRNRLDVAAEP